MKLRTLATLAALGAGAVVSGEAGAATYTLNLTGTVGSTVFGSGGGNVTAELDLGFGGQPPITLDNGDIIDFAITLDGPFAVPGTGASGAQFFGVNFRSTTLPDPSAAQNSGSLTFSGPPGTVGAGCGNCLSAIYGASGPVAGFIFTGLTGTTTISSLTSPFTIDDVTISYQVSAIPEPSTWALMLLGFAGLGFAGYRARKAAAVAV